MLSDGLKNKQFRISIYSPDRADRIDASGICYDHSETHSVLRHTSPQERPMPSNPWHVLHVISNHEKKVAQHLDVRSVEHYLPLYTEQVKWTDRTVVAERPLFSG